MNASSSEDTPWTAEWTTDKFSGAASQFEEHIQRFHDRAATRYFTSLQLVPQNAPGYQANWRNPFTGVYEPHLYNKEDTPVTWLLGGPDRGLLEIPPEIPFGENGMSAARKQNFSLEMERVQMNRKEVKLRNDSKTKALSYLERLFMASIPDGLKEKISHWKRDPQNADAKIYQIIQSLREEYRLSDPLASRFVLFLKLGVPMSPSKHSTVASYIASQRTAWDEFWGPRMIGVPGMTADIQTTLFNEWFLCSIQKAHVSKDQHMLPKMYEAAYRSFLADQLTLNMNSYTDRLNSFRAKMQNVESQIISAALVKKEAGETDGANRHKKQQPTGAAAKKGLNAVKKKGAPTKKKGTQYCQCGFVPAQCKCECASDDDDEDEASAASDSDAPPQGKRHRSSTASDEGRKLIAAAPTKVGSNSGKTKFHDKARKNTAKKGGATTKGKGIIAEAAFGETIEVAATADLNPIVTGVHVIDGLKGVLYSLNKFRNEGNWIILAPPEAGLSEAGYIVRHEDRMPIVRIDEDLTMDPTEAPPAGALPVELPVFHLGESDEWK